MTITVGAGVRSDDELVARARDGEPDAWAALRERHAPAAHAVARRHSDPDTDVEDVVAHAFDRVLAALQTDAGLEVAFRPYVLTVVNRVAERTRSLHHPVEPAADGTSQAPTVVESPRDAVEHAVERDIVLDAFGSLPPQSQAALWYTQVEGLTSAEVAPVLGMSPSAVAGVVARAREGLRQAALTRHAVPPIDDACVWAEDRLSAYIRGSLRARETVGMQEHLERCARCRAVMADLRDGNHGLLSVIAPLVLGAAGVDAIRGVGFGGAAGGVTTEAPAAGTATTEAVVTGAVVPGAATTGAATTGAVATSAGPAAASTRVAGAAVAGAAVVGAAATDAAAAGAAATTVALPAVRGASVTRTASTAPTPKVGAAPGTLVTRPVGGAAPTGRPGAPLTAAAPAAAGSTWPGSARWSRVRPTAARLADVTSRRPVDALAAAATVALVAVALGLTAANGGAPADRADDGASRSSTSTPAPTDRTGSPTSPPGDRARTGVGTSAGALGVTEPGVASPTPGSDEAVPSGGAPTGPTTGTTGTAGTTTTGTATGTTGASPAGATGASAGPAGTPAGAPGAAQSSAPSTGTARTAPAAKSPSTPAARTPAPAPAAPAPAPASPAPAPARPAPAPAPARPAPAPAPAPARPAPVPAPAPARPAPAPAPPAPVVTVPVPAAPVPVPVVPAPDVPGPGNGGDDDDNDDDDDDDRRGNGNNRGGNGNGGGGGNGNGNNGGGNGNGNNGGGNGNGGGRRGD
ncbi:sigma-70 family RNA polymerase sigma factor [Cellulomonas aerilata]|uniref:RNA polymerase sigma-70 region 2 domain-containing protein n=1 Tax=Cellulomonas aerilata TaxID=515326 RepID=A0A512D9R5_9CELL|nr:sigma-70 family RNA polymerase sigma factor [Cellulomonas aerilata]GEO33165.1 hypothetical protein CAE01nite_08900 [Cellulomonas aerilata]